MPARTVWPITLDRFPFRQIPFLRRVILRILALITQDQRRGLEWVVAAIRTTTNHGAALERQIRRAGERVAGLEAQSAQRFQEQAAQLAAQTGWIAEQERQLGMQAERVAEQERQLGMQAERIAGQERQIAELVQHAAESAALAAREREGLERRLEMRIQTARPTGAAQAVGERAASGSSEVDFTLVPGFYARFEEAFRGPVDLIRRRQAVYLPDFQAQEPTLATLPVVDLGCGRGEWLELLRENGVEGAGVDLNPDFLRETRAKGFDVADMDAVEWLAAREASSLRGVTAFHLIEHLPLTQLVRLLTEARRALAPGGLLILETPNPENLIVGACAFYLDPTHRRQVVPDLLGLLAREVGFETSRLLRLSEYRLENPLRPLPAEEHLAEALNPVIEAVGRTLFAAPDYALVAVRT